MSITSRNRKSVKAASETSKPILVIQNHSTRQLIIAEKMKASVAKIACAYFTRPTLYPDILPSYQFDPNILIEIITTDSTLNISTFQLVRRITVILNEPALFKVGEKPKLHAAAKLGDISKANIDEFVQIYESVFHKKVDSVELENIHRIFLNETIYESYYLAFEEKIYKLIKSIIVRYFSLNSDIDKQIQWAIEKVIRDFSTEIAERVIDIFDDFTE
jgi:hypothetical protein